MTDEAFTCAICGRSLDEVGQEATAHWGGPGAVEIVAWTCGTEHADQYDAKHPPSTR